MRHNKILHVCGTALGGLWIALSLTCVLSTDAWYVADPALESCGTVTRFLIHAVRCFLTGDIVTLSCLALGAGALLWFLPKLKTTRLERALAAVFGILCAMMQLLGDSYSTYGSWDAVIGGRFICFRSLVVLGGRALLGACAVLYGFRALDRLRKRPAPAQERIPWKRFLLASGIVILCWLPYYIAFFPGLSNPDTGMQIAWALHRPTEWLKYSAVRGPEIYATNHHPYFVTLLFGLFAKLGLAMGDITWGVAIYCFGQMLLTALVLTFVWYYLRRLGLPVGIFRIGLVFTALFPLFPLYAITMLKDSLFSLSCLAFSLLLFELARTRGEALRKIGFCALTFLTALLVALTKNQGVYFVAAAGVLCLIFCRFRLRALATLLIPVVLFQCVWVQVLLPAWNVAPGGKQEVLGLLFQQTARYVKEYPEDVTEAEEEAIRAVLDYDRLPELYKPHLADPVKFTYNQDATDEELSAYYQAWLSMLRHHPDVYIQAFLHNIYGGFYLGHETALSYTNFDNRETAPYPELCVPSGQRQEAAEAFIQVFLRAVQHIPVLGLLFRVGAYPWLVLFLFLDVLRRRQLRPILAQIPAILSVAVLFLAPVSGSYRYAMPMVYMAPFLLSAQLLPGGKPEPVPRLARQILRFAVVGGLCFLIDYGLLILFVEAVGLSTLTSSALSFSVSVVVNYLLSVRYVFRRNADGGKVRELVVFLGMSIMGLGLNQLLMHAGTAWLGIHYLLVKLAATVVVMVYNFITRKLFLERRV